MMEKLSEQFYEDLRKKIQPYFEGINSCHNFSHTQRVYNLALQLADDEDINIDVIKLASLLHDIGRRYQDESKGEICRAEKGAELARKLLDELGLDEELINKIIHCIETHRFRKDNPPKTKEAMIIFDADKLDAIGAIGILRSASFAGNLGAEVHNPNIKPDEKNLYTDKDSAYHEYIFKLTKIKDKMLTDKGRKIAENRHNFMNEFFQRANKEVIGEI